MTTHSLSLQALLTISNTKVAAGKAIGTSLIFLSLIKKENQLRITTSKKQLPTLKVLSLESSHGSRNLQDIRIHMPTKQS
jgi:hypothetical protein